MGLSRRLLFGSAIWELARPRTPLTVGHLVVRLSNPATALDRHSAADWLLCHNAARQALAEVLGARSCTLVFAHRWHPLGAAIGEPEAESSTPTFHLFGRWDGETVSPGAQLQLPAQRRLPASPEDLNKYDGGLRHALRRSADAVRAAAPIAGDTPEYSSGDDRPGDAPAGDSSAGAAAPAAGNSGQLPAIRSWTPAGPAGSHHTVLTPERGVAAVGEVTPLELLALAGALEGLARRRTGGGLSVSGLSCVVPDRNGAGGQLELHALGRSAGESFNPVEMLLHSPEISPTLL